MFLANGDQYEGHFVRGERQGRGRWTGVNGNTFTCDDVEALLGTRNSLEGWVCTAFRALHDVRPPRPLTDV